MFTVIALALATPAVAVAPPATPAAVPTAAQSTSQAPAQATVSHWRDATAQPDAQADTRIVDRLEQRRTQTPRDPAVLINLAAAYIAADRSAEARDAYRAAIASPLRVNLELADGSWQDSRKLAREGLDRLARQDTLALN